LFSGESGGGKDQQCFDMDVPSTATAIVPEVHSNQDLNDMGPEEEAQIAPAGEGQNRTSPGAALREELNR
jgi:hypothetical protein